MVHNIAGLLISMKQMREMASHLSQKPVSGLSEACHICRAEALKFQTRWVPLDYPKDSDLKKPRILLVLYEHDSEKKLNVEKAGRTKIARTAREWLKARGVSGAEKIKLYNVKYTGGTRYQRQSPRTPTSLCFLEIKISRVLARMRGSLSILGGPR
ncbi:hypothetical protein BDZ97DRAFT_590056 [Flammula alnicola]|nr:hypothetical protein BDZ97DRAFT_590056 [Flammula alnicola]